MKGMDDMLNGIIETMSEENKKAMSDGIKDTIMCCLDYIKDITGDSEGTDKLQRPGALKLVTSTMMLMLSMDKTKGISEMTQAELDKEAKQFTKNIPMILEAAKEHITELNKQEEVTEREKRFMDDFSKIQKDIMLTVFKMMVGGK